MSDLLGRLIARATRPLSPVQPILSSRYEPRVPIDDSLPAESSLQTDPLAMVARPPDLVNRADEGSPTERPLSSPPPIRVMESDRFTARTESSPRPALSASTAPPAIEIESPIPAAVIEDLRLTPRTVEPLREVEANTHRADGPSGELARIRSEPIRTKRVPAALPSVGDRPKRTSRRAESVDGERTDPVEVQVTIGHIEVRAAPPTKAPMRSTAPPRLSLHDYLKRRSGDAR